MSPATWIRASFSLHLVVWFNKLWLRLNHLKIPLAFAKQMKRLTTKILEKKFALSSSSGKSLRRGLDKPCPNLLPHRQDIRLGCLGTWWRRCWVEREEGDLITHGVLCTGKYWRRCLPLVASLPSHTLLHSAMFILQIRKRSFLEIQWQSMSPHNLGRTRFSNRLHHLLLTPG